jgi:hypothetical protein
MKTGIRPASELAETIQARPLPLYAASDPPYVAKIIAIDDFE